MILTVAVMQRFFFMQNNEQGKLLVPLAPFLSGTVLFLYYD
jgi:hypothetical protein